MYAGRLFAKKIFASLQRVRCRIESETIANKECCSISRFFHDLDGDKENELEQDDDYEEISREYLNPETCGYRTFILQPYVKWGNKKRRNTTPELQLDEAEALVNTLNNWTVVEKATVPLLSLDKKKLLGKGNLEKLQTLFNNDRSMNALFVSKNILRPVQTKELESALGVTIFDRYSIVIRIFREHAKTPEAKLQVALAELPYIRKKITYTIEDDCSRINFYERRKMIIQARETKLRNALEKLKQHRKLIRQSRTTKKIPTVAVVGYTNAGKTSLIKALTGDESMEPKNYLFATLDTTAHEGTLPSNLKTLYMDTIGFIQDVPESLIEPFIATFEDAIIADVIVHVFDASHPDRQAQIEHVEHTLEMLLKEEKPVINVANKCDLVEEGNIPESALAVSSTAGTGIDFLRETVEKKLLEVTDRRTTKIRVRSGSLAYSWLYKETAVTNVEPDPKDPQYLLMDVIATPLHLHKFRQFLKE